MRSGTPLLALALLLACGPSAGDDDDDDDSGGGSVGDDDDGADDGETGVPSTCEGYLGDDPGPSVEVTVQNTTAEPIFVDWTFGIPWLTMDVPDVDWSWLYFGAPCDAIVSAGADTSCAEGVPLPQVARIDPGAALSFTWDGTLTQDVPVPLDCVHPDDADQWPCVLIETCGIRHAPPAGAYSATLSAYPQMDDSGAPTTTECEGDPCIIEHAFVVGEPMEASVEFAYPTDAVTLVF